MPYSSWYSMRSRWSRQFLGLPHRNEAGIEGIGYRGSENEAARFNTDHDLNFLPLIGGAQIVDDGAQARGVLQERSNGRGKLMPGLGKSGTPRIKDLRFIR